jgi:DNA-binding transcriptional ArsR family regulator
MHYAGPMVVIESERAKTLRDRTRSDILGILSETPMTIKQLATHLHKSPPTILYHLRRLQKFEFVEVAETRNVRNYVEKYYRSMIPKTTEIILAAPVISKSKTKDLRKKPYFFRGKEFTIEEESWKDIAHQLLTRFSIADLSEREQRRLLTNYV